MAKTRRSRAISAAHTSHGETVAPLERSMDMYTPDERHSQHRSQRQAVIVTSENNNLQRKSRILFSLVYLTQYQVEINAPLLRPMAIFLPIRPCKPTQGPPPKGHRMQVHDSKSCPGKSS